MRTAEENYRINPEFRALVDYMENFIHRLQYTPSEMREAAMLACVNYEMKRPRSHFMHQDSIDPAWLAKAGIKGEAPKGITPPSPSRDMGGLNPLAHEQFK